MINEIREVYSAAVNYLSEWKPEELILGGMLIASAGASIYLLARTLIPKRKNLEKKL